MNLLKIFTFLAILIMIGCSANASTGAVEVVSPAEFHTQLSKDANAYLLDVRRPEEYEAGHINGAHLLNWLATDNFKKEAENLDKSKTIYVYCRSGRRSYEAAEYLSEHGYKVVDLDGGILAWEQCGLPVVKDEDPISDQIEQQRISHDSFTTKSGHCVKIHFIKHASLILEIDGKTIYIDPTGMFGNDFTKLPKANAVMVTHEHHDHFDPEVIAAVSTTDTRLIASGRVTELLGKGESLAPGDSIEVFGFTVTATPSYNITAGHLQYHPKDRKDVGFLYDIDGLRIYVAGDTEDIPELSDLKEIGIAFLPVNQPFTMTPAQAIHAIKMIRPKIVYPYHYGDTDLSPISEAFKTDKSIEVRIRELQ
ncbi:MAG: MBL fold metallo-hydrolase [Bacteroides sp.]|nr:MBL fold metallo-hydrolase [Bacteroides sp.]MCM1414256.1 MBL fold metallo-hydrolase [Bacteroides sp.]MCM1471209.1 MBL fold metallo-hydrolase [Bacteroides sp.]